MNKKRLKEASNKANYDLVKKFKFFNKLIFGNKLTLDFPLSWHKNSRYLGVVNVRYFNSLEEKRKYIINFLKISDYFELPEIILDNTLIHEMIHVLQIQTQARLRDGVDPHNAFSLTKAREINNKFPEYHINVSDSFADVLKKVKAFNARNFTFYIAHIESQQLLQSQKIGEYMACFKKYDKRELARAIANRQSKKVYHITVYEVEKKDFLGYSITKSTSFFKGDGYLINDKIKKDLKDKGKEIDSFTLTLR